MNEIERFNPKLLQSVRKQYEGCESDSIAKISLGHLATAYFAKDKDFLAEHVEKLFDSKTEPATRNMVLELIGGWDTSSDLKATILLLLLENQFPHPDDLEHHKWLESTFVDLPVGYSKSKFASKAPLRFESDIRYAYAWNFGSPISGNQNTAQKTALQRATETPAAIRGLLSTLWSVAWKTKPSLSPEYKKNELPKFLSKWMSINDIEAIYGDDLKIASDVQKLIQSMENGSPEISIPATEASPSLFVTEFRGLRGGSRGSGGRFGGGIF